MLHNPEKQDGKRALFWDLLNEGLKYEGRYNYMDTPMLMDAYGREGVLCICITGQ